MARKTAVVTISDEGRDKGKIFVIREAPAAQAERWATKVLLALARSGVDMPENAEGAGWAGLAYLGFQALSKLRFEEVQPLFDEMWACVSLRPDPRHPEVIRPLLLEGEAADIEEIATMIKLRAEVFALHSGFSLPGVNSTSKTSTTQTSGELRNTKTSGQSMATPLVRRSPPGRRLSRN